MNIAVIPARGGSKRVPRKNIRKFAGKPMIAYSIECANQSGLFERVIVSTDDEEIAQASRDYGAEIPFLRPSDLADDNTGTTEVVAHAVQQLRDLGADPAAVCCIYPTAPFIRVGDLAAALGTLESGDWDFVFSATDYAYPIWRSFGQASDGGVRMHFPKFFETRSQDLPFTLHDAGQFYWGRPHAWLDQERVFGARSTVAFIPRWRVQDIDTEDDWVRAESVSQYIWSRAEFPR